MATTDKKERAEQILAAADELFGELGFAGVSMRDVAVGAGVNKALLFYYFGSKEALFEAVLERYYAAHRAAFEHAFSGDQPLRARIHRVLDAYLDFIDANRRYPRLVQSVISGAPGHHSLIENNLRVLFRFVDVALASTAPADGPQSARHLFVTLSGAVINYFTYAPVLEGMWGSDPLSPPAIAERRAHLHWLVETLLDALEAAKEGPGGGVASFGG